MAEECLTGKKLLILGGGALVIDIVKRAKALGVYTIITDWCDLYKSPAKLIADKYWDISLTDYPLLCEKINKEQVDGIITGFTDSYLLPYQHLCELNHFPCYATKEQFEWSLDKALFKKKCRHYGVPVVPEYDLNAFNPKLIDKDHKVMIKPVDNSGSRGISLCEDPKYFRPMLEESLSFSRKRQVILEQYMDCDDVSFEYTIQDGCVMLSAICDRYIFKTHNTGSVTSKLVYPSKYLKVYCAETDEKVRGMLKDEGFKNGVLFMQAFVKSNKFFFYEMGYRLSGGRHYIFTENENNRSGANELVRFALTGKMAKTNLSDIINPKFNNICCQISILCKGGKIGSITGQDKLRNRQEIIDVAYYYNVGDVIGEAGTTAQIFARVHIVVEAEEQLHKVIDFIYDNLVVESFAHQNLILKVYQ